MTESTAPAAVAVEPIVDVRDVSYGVGDRMIFEGLDMQAQRGEITAVMGPSGTGKTTLLRLLMGAIAPASGRVAGNTW